LISAHSPQVLEPKKVSRRERSARELACGKARLAAHSIAAIVRNERAEEERITDGCMEQYLFEIEQL
jgi:hypothetical protein